MARLPQTSANIVTMTSVGRAAARLGGLALVAGICSVVRLNRALRRPRANEERELQPAPQLR